MKVDLVDLIKNHNGFDESLKGDDGIRILLENAVEQEFHIIPSVDGKTGQKQYMIWKMVDGEELALNPILAGDWIPGFDQV